MYSLSFVWLMMILEAVDQAELLIRMVPNHVVHTVGFESVIGIDMASLVYYVLFCFSHFCSIYAFGTFL